MSISQMKKHALSCVESLNVTPPLSRKERGRTEKLKSVNSRRRIEQQEVVGPSNDGQCEADMPCDQGVQTPTHRHAGRYKLRPRKQQPGCGLCDT